MLKHYVEYMYPGIMVSETDSKQIPERSFDHALPMPKEAFAFRYFDMEEVNSDGEILKGKEKNSSGLFYTGEKLSAKDVEERVPDNKILLSNMEGNGYKYVVKTKFGQYMPLGKKDVVIA